MANDQPEVQWPSEESGAIWLHDWYSYASYHWYSYASYQTVHGRYIERLIAEGVVTECQLDFVESEDEQHVHWGRVNSLKRMWRARKAGANSADGTYITFAPDLLLPRVCRWLDKVNAQPRLIPDSIALYAPAHPGCAVRHCGAEVVGAIAHRQESRAVCEVHGTQLVRELGWRWVVPQ